MTLKEFWKMIDDINVDEREDGRFTEEEMYQIGCAFIELPHSLKVEFGGWDKLVEVLKPLNRNGEVETKGENFRGWVKYQRNAREEMIHNDRLISGKTIDEITFKEFEDQTEKIKQNLYKQQIKTRDVMNGYRRSLRDEARVESFKDELVSAIKTVPELPKVEFVPSENDERTNEACLCLSDWHWGTYALNFKQEVNSDVLRHRLEKVVKDAKEYCEKFNVEILHVLGLSDFIAGYIHNTIRIEQQMDVAQQVIESSEAMAEVLLYLQAAAPVVYYHQVTGNHDRMIPDKSDSIERESFCKITWWYLQERLKKSGIIFAKNGLDESLGTFTLRDGKICCYEHGHLGSKQSSFQNMCAATQNYVSYVFLAHYHSSSARDYQGCRVFVNGSLVGPEDYAISKRLFSDPCQKLVIFGNDGNIVDIDIKFEY